MKSEEIEDFVDKINEEKDEVEDRVVVDKK